MNGTKQNTANRDSDGFVGALMLIGIAEGIYGAYLFWHRAAPTDQLVGAIGFGLGVLTFAVMVGLAEVAHAIKGKDLN